MKLSWRTEVPQLVLIAGMLLLAAISWPTAPERIPVHWNIAGEIDRYGGKVEGLLAIPLLSLGLYGLMLVLPRIDPGRANYPSFVGAYTTIRVALITLLALLYGVVHLSLRGRPVAVSTVTPLLAGGLFVVLGNLMGKIRPNWFVGIRTPWTLSSKLAWVKTHRLGGWLFILGGVGLMATAVLRASWTAAAILAGLIGVVLWTVVYSYLVWRRNPDKVPPTGTLPAEDG